MRLRYRVLLLVGGVVLAILVASLLVVQARVRAEILRRTEVDLDRALSNFRRLEQARFDAQGAIAQGLERDPALRVVLKTDYSTLEAYVLETQVAYALDLIILTDPSGATIFSTAHTKPSDIDVSSETNLDAALEGYQISGYWNLETGLYQVTTVPMVGAQGVIEGTLTVGSHMNAELAEELGKDLGGFVSFWTDNSLAGGKEALSDPLYHRGGQKVTDLPKMGARFKSVLDGKHLIGVRAPLTSAEQVAAIALVQDIGQDLEVLRSTTRDLAVLGLLALVSALLVSIPIVGKVTNSAELLEIVVETVGDGLIHLDENFTVEMANPQAANLLKLEVEAMESLALFDLLALEGPSEKWNPASLNASFAQGDSIREDDGRLTRIQDGSRFATAFVFAPMFVGNKLVGAVLVFRDISPIKEMQDKLVQVSHRAGMAEVATGTLHNVGNALNSVQVSAGLAEEKVRGSRLSKLAQALEMLDRPTDELSDFFAADPKAAKLSEYLKKLAEHLKTEQSAVLEELSNLTNSVVHIQEIVRTQQTTAGNVGIKESTRVESLAEQAITLGAASATSGGVQFVREFADLPAFQLERHKMLQILTNLISNALHALKQATEDPVITVRTRIEDQSLLLEVQDNGPGIEQENLTKVFQYGFTTRREGHGFGLHNSALAAVELGGRLTAHCEGLNQGALFRLELPLDQI